MNTHVAQHVLNDNLHLREWVRRKADLFPTSFPIRVVAGMKPPSLEGESFHYTNKSGDRIYHPRAYSKKGFFMIYHPSSIRIEAGLLWLQARRPKTFGKRPLPYRGPRTSIWEHLDGV